MELGIRCYDVFRSGRIAFEREGKLCFGLTAKLFTFLFRSEEILLTNDEAEAKIAELRKRQGESRYNSRRPVSNENDELAATRKRWESQRASGQWGSSRTSANS